MFISRPPAFVAHFSPRHALSAPVLAVRFTRRHALVAASSAVALVLVVDTVLDRTALSLAAKALLDESAHLATALLLLGALARRPSARFMLGAALGAVLIDLDHIPALLAHHGDQFGVPRPDTHSLLTILIIAAVALPLPARYRAILLGVACGIATHFIRDMATGGVPLLWPFSGDFYTLPYAAYAALLPLCVGITAWRAQHHGNFARRTVASRGRQGSA